MTQLSHVVVVGAGLAGARSCEQLREQGHVGRITLLGAEPHLPYDRPPLSKEVLTGATDSSLLGIDYDALDVHVRAGVRALGLCPSDRVVVTDGGEIEYDGVVLATGSDPVRLPGGGEQLTLRTIGDALTLRQRLTPGARVLVIGAGWIGAEVATAARTRGCSVTCVELDPFPLERLMGPEVGKRVLPWWEGIDLRVGTAVSAVSPAGVELADGETLPADVVVTGIGVQPATGWLEDSGLELDRGVVTDEWLRAGPCIVAAGDVAAWWSRRYRTRMRVEHWDDASSAPSVAVAALLALGLGDLEPHDPVPYFWSDQLGHKLQYVGRHTDSDRLVFREREDGSWTALWLDDDDKLAAALIADLPRENAQAQMAILRGLVLDPTLIADPAVPLTKAVHAG